MTLTDFFRVWILDAISYPIRCFSNLKIKHQTCCKIRKEVDNPIVYICVHEWGGYLPERIKKLKNITSFSCGLKYQLKRFHECQSSHPIHLTITMSDPEKYSQLALLKDECDNFISVSNIGMDFSGYWAFLKSIRTKRNAYVILCNSSVNQEITDFIDDYINYLDQNKDVGILGISSSSKYYHTLIRNNFNPHLQSFFLMTTLDVLNQIVEVNGGVFPGITETNKHLLIRNGEVKISRLALKLGYNLAIVTEDGQVKKFNYNSYPMEKGDLRCNASYPNRINPIKNLS